MAARVLVDGRRRETGWVWGKIFIYLFFGG